MKVLLKEDYPEETNPHILYDLRDKLDLTARLLVKWNRKEVEPNEVCNRLYNLFDDYCKREWDKTVQTKDARIKHRRKVTKQSEEK